MDDRTIFVVLRLLHVVCGVFWGGAAVMLAWFVIPAARSAGPAGGRVMQEVMGTRRLSMWLGIGGGLTVLSGVGMFWRLARGSHGAWMHTRMGLAITVGAMAALAAYGVGAFVSAPTGKRITTLGARLQSVGGPPDAGLVAEMQALQSRAQTASRTAAGLVLVAVLAMATARYL